MWIGQLWKIFKLFLTLNWRGARWRLLGSSCMWLDWCARLLYCWSWHGPCAGRYRSMYKFQLHTWMIIFPITSEGGFWDVQHLPAAPWPSHQRWCCSSTEVAKQPLCSQVITLTKGGSDESTSSVLCQVEVATCWSLCRWQKMCPLHRGSSLIPWNQILAELQHIFISTVWTV